MIIKMLFLGLKSLAHFVQRRVPMIILEGLTFTHLKEAATLKEGKLFVTQLIKVRGMLGHVCLVDYWLLLQAQC